MFVIGQSPVSDLAWNIIVSAITFLYFIMIVAMAYAWHHRDFPPLKAKHIGLLSTGLLGCFLWWVGVLQTNGLVPIVGVFRYCAVWGLWVEYIGGVMLLLYSLTFRLHALYVCFVRRRSLSQSRRLFFTALYFLPMVAIGIYTLVAPEDTVREVAHTDHVNDCWWRPMLRYSAMSGTLLAMSILSWFVFALRRIRRGFNEFTESLVGIVGAASCLILNFTLLLTQHNREWWALLATLLVHALVVNTYFWLVLFRPIYGCLFHREAYLRRFVAQLQNETVVGSHVLPPFGAPLTHNPYLGKV